MTVTYTAVSHYQFPRQATYSSGKSLLCGCTVQTFGFTRSLTGVTVLTALSQMPLLLSVFRLVCARCYLLNAAGTT